MNPEKAITAITRGQARRFLSQFETELAAEIDYYQQPDRMAEGKFIELFSIEKAELKPRLAAFTRAMTELTNGGQPDMQAIQDGLDIVAGMVRIASNADTMAPSHAKPKKVAGEFRHRNELGDAPFTPRDKRIIRETVQQRQKMAGEVERDAEQWRDAARQMVEIAKGVGIDAQPYVEGLGLSRFQE